jgi:hypothetical protein
MCVSGNESNGSRVKVKRLVRSAYLCTDSKVGRFESVATSFRSIVSPVDAFDRETEGMSTRTVRNRPANTLSRTVPDLFDLCSETNEKGQRIIVMVV